jgi:hypothetical protein
MIRRVFVGVAVLLLVSCDGPEMGELVFDLTTPHDDDGAIHFTITAYPGAEVFDLEAACAGCQLFTRTVDARRTLGIVTGPIVPGEFVRALVSDAGRPRAFILSVVEVANRAYDLQPLEGYRISVAR